MRIVNVNIFATLESDPQAEELTEEEKGEITNWLQDTFGLTVKTISQFKTKKTEPSDK